MSRVIQIDHLSSFDFSSFEVKLCHKFTLAVRTILECLMIWEIPLPLIALHIIARDPL